MCDAHQYNRPDRSQDRIGSGFATKVHLNITPGSELLKSERNADRQSQPIIQAQYDSVDKLLQACVQPGLMSLAAEDSNDRSTVSLYIALGFLLQSQKYVSIVDSNGSFDVVNVLRILQHRLAAGSSSNTRPSPLQMALLERMHVSRVFDMEGLKQTICELDIQSNTEDIANDLGMIIVDNIANIFNTEINKDKVHGYAQLEKLCLSLRKLAVERQIVVVLLNTLATHSGFDASGVQSGAELIPSLGRNFADLLDSSLILLNPGRQANQSNPNRIRVLKVLKDPVGLGQEQTASFMLRDGYKLESVSGIQVSEE